MSKLGFAGEAFRKVSYLAYLGAGSGESASNPAAFVDADLWAIPAGTLINKAYVVITTLITGTTVFEVGDDDDADGFIVNASVTLGTVGMYGWSAKVAGAYLRTETAGVTDAADVYVVPNAKYYAAAGKEVKLNVTTTNTAGAAYVVVEGVYFGR